VLDSDDTSDTKDFNFIASNNTKETKAIKPLSDLEPKLIKTLWRLTILYYIY
jgi:hypothetical protein